MKKIIDPTYSFYSLFEETNGIYYRSNIFIDEVQTWEEPYRASFPHLLDIGIMGQCIHGLSGLCDIQCYQSGSILSEQNMSLDDYKKIIDQCEHNVFQVALGGRGDADCHEDFEEILKYTKEKGIVPNITTSGFLMNEEKAKIIKKYCGAAAVSYYKKDYTYKAIDLLKQVGVPTNLHYVLSNDSIDEAIELFKKDEFPLVDKIIFLLHKPIGLGTKNNVLQVDDPRVKEFFDCIDQPKYLNRIGFDSCLVPGIIQFTKNIPAMAFDSCEAARFSGYIDHELNFSPCSFDRLNRFSLNLKNYSLQEIWDSDLFKMFNQRNNSNCTTCTSYKHCLGGCPIIPSINLCKNIHEGVSL